MNPGTDPQGTGENTSDDDKPTLELRRGVLTLAVLGELRRAGYGYSLLRRLAERGLEVEQGTLYPLLRRLDEHGLLESDWNVEGSRPRKYYRLSPRGSRLLERMTAVWSDLVEVVEGLLDDHGSDERDE